jgi:muramoyltetrapeptide carboxypeptidase
LKLPTTDGQFVRYKALDIYRDTGIKKIAHSEMLKISWKFLHSFFVEKCGFVTVHGPNITTLSTCDNDSKEQIFQLLQGEKQALTIHNSRLEIAVPGTVSGMVKGGNLASIISLIGTPYQPDFSDAILFLEEVGEVPYKVDRMLTQMRLAGMFDKVKGVVLGDFTYEEYRPPATKSVHINQIMENMELPSSVPVVYNFAAGHGTKNMAFLLGAEATLDTEKKSLSYL